MTDESPALWREHGKRLATPTSGVRLCAVAQPEGVVRRHRDRVAVREVHGHQGRHRVLDDDLHRLSRDLARRWVLGLHQVADVQAVDSLCDRRAASPLAIPRGSRLRTTPVPRHATRSTRLSYGRGRRRAARCRRDRRRLYRPSCPRSSAPTRTPPARPRLGRALHVSFQQLGRVRLRLCSAFLSDEYTQGSVVLYTPHKSNPFRRMHLPRKQN